MAAQDGDIFEQELATAALPVVFFGERRVLGSMAMPSVRVRPLFSLSGGQCFGFGPSNRLAVKRQDLS